MNLPNLLTLARFVMAFFMLRFILEGGSRMPLALALFLLASMTDYWDGRLARSRGSVTLLGTVLDPLADKTLTLAALFGFWWLELFPGLWVGVIALRDIGVTSARLIFLGHGIEPAVRKSGKNKTFFQMIYISLVLFYLSARPASFWNAAWDGPALALVRGGMVLIVLLTLWSGARVLWKTWSSRPARA